VGSPLTDERWRRPEALFLTATELAPEERDGFIARETADDPDLASELAGMLAHASDGGPRIARAIGGVASAVAATSGWTGRRVGAYRIIREIGHGGMVLVFEAVRDDDEYLSPWRPRSRRGRRHAGGREPGRRSWRLAVRVTSRRPTVQEMRALANTFVFDVHVAFKRCPARLKPARRSSGPPSPISRASAPTPATNR
jgi:hypothetical protein